jgi:hypothetical protein
MTWLIETIFRLLCRLKKSRDTLLYWQTMTILKHYGHKNVAGYPSKHGADDTLPQSNWLVGCELEIEGWKPEDRTTFGGFTFTNDNSLRARDGLVGIEAITLPTAIKHIPSLLTAFYQHFKITEKNYSERCSLHVHFNALPLTFEQVSTICLLYQTVEDLLFKFVGHDRDQNIFCVPWSQSNISYNIVSKMTETEGNEIFRRWQKYSALNLIPITTQGTMEFRHLPGTCDVKKITTWIALLASLFDYAQQVDLEKAKYQITNMNTVSNYHEWLNMVFGKWADALRCEGFEAVLAQGVINSKLMLNKPEKSVKDDWLSRVVAAEQEAVMREVEEARTAAGWNPPLAPAPIPRVRRPALAPGARTIDVRPTVRFNPGTAEAIWGWQNVPAQAAAVPRPEGGFLIHDDIQNEGEF